MTDQEKIFYLRKRVTALRRVLNSVNAEKFPLLYKLRKTEQRLAEVEKERDRWEKHATTGDDVLMRTRDRLTAAEAALAEARKVIEESKAVLNLYLGEEKDHRTSKQFVLINGHLRYINEWLTANPTKETKG